MVAITAHLLKLIMLLGILLTLTACQKIVCMILSSTTKPALDAGGPSTPRKNVMNKFKIGDLVKRIVSANYYYGAVNKWRLDVGTVCMVTQAEGKMIKVAGFGVIGGAAEAWHDAVYFELIEVQATPLVVQPEAGRARANDPDTSKKAARIKRTPLRQRIYECISNGCYGTQGTGWTGKELAAYLSAPLNSVTPRFADLIDGIKDSGLRRDGQIAWVLK
jgi:hypothetical protein